MTLDEFIGLTEYDALCMAAMHHIPVRLVRRDGIPFLKRRDFCPTRVNLTVVDNIVTAATFG